MKWYFRYVFCPFCLNPMDKIANNLKAEHTTMCIYMIKEKNLLHG